MLATDLSFYSLSVHKAVVYNQSSSKPILLVHELANGQADDKWVQHASQALAGSKCVDLCHEILQDEGVHGSSNKNYSRSWHVSRY